MKFYELTYLISPEVSETEIKDLQQKLDSFVQNKEGILDSSSPPEKTNLSYPIKKEDQAYLSSLSFYLKPEEVSNLKKEVKSESQILRFLISIKKKPKVTKISKRPLAKKPEKEKKSKLKDIEQKLEEILGK